MKICLSCEGVVATDQERCAHCDLPLLPTATVHYPVRHGEVDASNPLLGTIVDEKYRIQGVLGRGGMGTVFRAAHAVSLVPVALKLLHPRLSARPEYRRALLAEARKAGRIVHEHCARVLDVGETEEGTVYLAMELAEGETLDQWVRGRGLSPAVAVVVLEQICRALAAIHAAGLVHRDLSARNVMVAARDGAPAVKVLDFGIAQSVALAPRTAADEDGETAFGNPVFSAPEQLAGLEVDARADLYSLGVIGYLLLTGSLPVRKAAARAAAQDTIAGRREPLPPLPGVPPRLHLLVEQCLQRDPAARPASAAAVLAALVALRQPGLRWLPAASVAAFAVAIVFSLLAFVRTAPSFLRPVGGRLLLIEGGLAPGAEVQYLRSEDLQSLRAHFGGFAARQLVLEITREQELQKRQPLQPSIDRGGVLVLSEAQTEWRDAVQGLVHASAKGPVELAFVVPGRALLGSARLRIDDAAPTLAWSLLGDHGTSMLTGGSLLRWQVADDIGVLGTAVEVRFLHGGRFAFDLEGSGGDFPIGDELARRLSRIDDLGPAEIEVVARDRAGNVTRPPALQVAAADLAAPAVEAVTGPAGEATVPFVNAVAQLRVRLSALEPGLNVEVSDPAGELRSAGLLQPVGSGMWCRLEMLGDADEAEPFAAGVHTFAVVDRAGNRTERQFVLAFRNRHLDDEYTAGTSSAGRAAVVGREIVVDPGGAALEFTCAAAFVPMAVRLSAAGTVPLVDGEPAHLLAARAGAAAIVLSPLPPGSYLLTVELEETGEERGAHAATSRSLRVLPPQLLLRLPDIGAARFLPALVRAGMFDAVGDTLREGPAVRIDAQLRRYLRGALWVGAEPTRLAPVPLAVGSANDPEARILPDVRLLPGRNVFALELRDVLGRPVAVRLGDAEAVPQLLPDRPLLLLADIHHTERAPQPVGEARVEHGRAARLEFRTELPFQASDEDAIRLRVGAAELAPTSLRRSDGETRIAFLLPFSILSQDGPLARLPREDYTRSLLVQLDGQLATPAGVYPVQIALRSARTTLRVLTLGELAVAGTAGRLSQLQQVQQVQMVPVLAPVDGVFGDPVPDGVAGRGLFRAQPAGEVRNMADHFLQDREFTLGQYADLLRMLPLHAPREDLVHADDPAGTGRLTTEHMLPAAFRGRAEAFFAAARERADAAVAGVDFHQAFAATRLVGWLLLGDAEALRLPLGCELELAAFGSEPPGAARHGAAARGGRVVVRDWLESAADLETGPTAAQCRAAGDLVPGGEGAFFFGLDFGLREWVLDLPQGLEPGAGALVREWVADHVLHGARALQFAGGKAPPSDLRGRFRTFAVLRGLPAGDRTGLLDGNGAVLQQLPATLPPSVPGVVRTEHMRRDGRDIQPGAMDPRLMRTGFRLAGGLRFVELVRSR